MSEFSIDAAVDAAIPSPEPLTSLFVRRAQSRADMVASYSKVDGKWVGTTWGEALVAVQETALGLLEVGVRRGDAVGIVANTCREWSQVDMAILAIGGITVGVYPTLTVDQTKYVLEHSQVKAVFVQDRALRDKVLEASDSAKVVTFEPKAEGDRVMTLDALRRMGAKRRRAQPEEFERRVEENKPSDVVTRVYTSGTTGEPKGAELTHSNFHYVIHASNRLIPYDDEVTLAFLPLAHSLQRYASYLALLADVEGYYAESLDTVRDNILEVRPTCFATVPRILEKVHGKVIAMAAEAGGAKAEMFSRSMRYLRARGVARRSGLPVGFRSRVKANIADRIVGDKIREVLGGRVKFLGCGGAPLNPEVHEFFEDLGIAILEGWGLTETSAPVCVNTMVNRRVGTVGRPLPGTRVKIAQDGEILVHGPGVFKGYFQNAEATAASFDDDGWFKTGDVGEMSRDGFLKITDRKKDLIITAGGKNIAPQPIEASIMRDATIGQAVVIGDKKPYLTALIGIDGDARAQLASQHGLPEGTDLETLAATPAVKAMIDRHIDRVNSQLPRFEQIKKWVPLPDEMTVETGELTPTMKVKRRVVHERHANRIESMYG